MQNFKAQLFLLGDGSATFLVFGDELEKSGVITFRSGVFTQPVLDPMDGWTSTRNDDGVPRGHFLGKM